MLVLSGYVRSRGKDMPIEEEEGSAYILRTGNTFNRVLWPSGKATDLKSVPVAQMTDSKSVGTSGRRFESYQHRFFCISIPF